MEPIAILGTGMAGLGAGHALAAEGASFVCFDRNPYYGGHTATFVDPSGFQFDEGPHISFTKDPRIRDLLAENVNGRYREVQAHVDNYWHGHRITHPVQCNLKGLPNDLVVKILTDFVEARTAVGRPISSYAEWLRTAYGATFAETFPRVYGRKYHTVDAERMTTEWLGPRMYRPDLAEMLKGALQDPAKSVHYVTTFRYPLQGGFAAYLRPLAERFELRLGHQLVGLDPKRRALRFANGVEARYARVVSSIPLPELIPLIDGVPGDVREAARRLAFSTVVLVDLGVDREDLSTAHITYIYDEDVIFPRISFPHMFSPHNVPPGAGSIQVELYFSDKYRPLDRSPASLIDPVIAGLRQIGTLRENDRILFRGARVARYANVIYDHDRAKALAAVHGFLDEIEVHYCGRYGDWDHAWTDESFLSGERAARTALASRS